MVKTKEIEKIIKEYNGKISEADAAIIYKARTYTKRNKLINWFVIMPIRIVLFPIALIIKIFKWTYGYYE